MTDTRFAHPKSELRAVLKKRRQKMDQKNERACREITRKRDGGRCRIPNCSERAAHLHHIVYRSHSSRRKWHPGNCCWLCVDHHRLVHGGAIRITGDADAEIVITGDVDRLKFRI